MRWHGSCILNPKKYTVMQTNMIVTTSDYNRLMGLLKFSVTENNKSDIVFNLYQRLTAAKKLPGRTHAATGKGRRVSEQQKNDL